MKSVNISSFICEDDYEQIAKSISGRNIFEYRKGYKGNIGKVDVRIYSSVVDDSTAKRIWRGNNYLVHFDENHNGKKIGCGGRGRAVDEFHMFKGWNEFKDWFNAQMKSYDWYEVEEYGQISLF